MSRVEGNALLNLFKYRSLAPPFGRDFLTNVIQNDRMWWQSPLAFNDPFDCHPVLIFGENAGQRVAFAKRASKNLKSIPRQQRRSQARELLKKRPEEHEASMTAAFREWMADTSVTCFSDVCDHPLMWAHYADSYRGVCLIFREQIGPDPWVAFEVTYSKERPTVNFAGPDRNEVITMGLLNKSDLWSYESEYRMIDYRSKPGFRPLPRNVLVGVIYGARMSESDKEFVGKLSAARERFEIYESSVDPRFFKLNLARIG